jgi:peptidylprolyl isomerase
VSQSKKSRKKPPPQLGTSSTPTWARGVVIVIIAALVIGLFGFLAFDRDDDSPSDVNAGGSSSTAGPPDTTPAAGSAAGKPCVALADPLPAGAPEVPVAVGPPPTQLVSEDLVVGTGATVEPTSTITVDYIGVACSTGKIFDTSYGSQPATFPLNQVIPGWQQGLPGMKVGGTRLLGIPADLAYGANGYPPDIAPDEALWFVVQAKSVQAG